MTKPVKGAPSKTRRGEKDYTTKKTSKTFHEKGHDVKKGERSPYRMTWNEFVATHTKGKHFKSTEAVGKNLSKLAKQWRKLNK